MEDIVIGIDLGTTNSCASYYYDGQLKVLVNREGGRITPSVVYYTEKNAAIVGEYAKRMAIAKPNYAVYEIKRLVGRRTDDPYVQNNLRYFPFKLDTTSNEPIILIEQTNETIKKSPTDVCAAILTKIKLDVEDKLGHSVEKAVITVPAYFNVNQREVTLAAASKAGFTVLKLLNEPTAAALSYYIENNCEAENHSLVYDLGGGTFDVAILRRTSGNIDILCVDGDSHLGGQDFDNLIIDYVCSELQTRYKYDPRVDRRTMRRLHNHCEEAKKTLSVAEETTLILDGFVKNCDTVEIGLTRTQFETMANDFFLKTIQIVDNCLKSSDLPKESIKEVILSGGSTRIPKIQNMLSDFFAGKALNKFVNPDECVAEGAALQAAMLSSNSKQQMTDIRITDVTPLSLGLANFVDRMSVLIRRNSTIPVSASSNRINAYNKQKSMIFKVYEGERSDARKNRYLGDMTIYDISPAPPGQCEIVVTMTVDKNGILTVFAKETLKDNTKDLRVTYTRGNRSEKEVKNALRDAEEHKNEDKEFDRVISIKEYVLKYAIACMYNFENKDLTASYNDLYELCKTIKLEAEPLDVEDENKIKKLLKDVEGGCQSVAREYNFEFMPKV